MNDATPWIEHLKHPLVLFGFVLLVLATLLKTFRDDKLSGKDTGLLMDKGLLYTFVVAVLIIVLGFISSIVQQQAAAPQAAIIQHSAGKQSPNSVGAVSYTHLDVYKRQRMVQELCKLYDSPVSELDIDQFLNFSQGGVNKSIPLLLAVAGNGLKAFPGVGTVAGGLVHAGAYGLIFDALGHAVAHLSLIHI